MEQKRILWIVAAVGIFLLVVVGAALILYAPQKQNSIQITETNNGSNSTGHDLLDFNGNLTNGSSIPSTVKELTVIAENNVSIEYMYGLSVETTDASIVMKTNQLNEACNVLKNKNIGTMTEKEIESL